MLAHRLDRADNGEERALDLAEVRYALPWIKGYAETGKRPISPPALVSPRDVPFVLGRGDLAGPKVLKNAQRRKERQVLVDKGHPEFLELSRSKRQVHFAPSDVERSSRLRCVVAGQDLDERGFSGAVLSKKPVDLPRADSQADVV